MRKESLTWLVGVCALLLSGITLAQVRTGTISAEKLDSETNSTGLPCTATDQSVPSGLVVDITPQQTLDLRAVNNPCISGVAFQIHWSDIEPGQTNPDWSRLDELFAAAEASKKWVHLEVFPGFFCSCLGSGRGKERAVRNTIRTWQRHSSASSDALGHCVPQPLVCIPEGTKRPVWKVACF
jgi:hypothetical protein